MRAALLSFTEAANLAAQIGFSVGAFGRAALHRAAYHKVRQALGVSSIVADTAVKHAAAVFARDKTQQPTFRQNGVLPLNRDSLRIRPDSTVRLRLNYSNIIVPFICGERQRGLLAGRTRDADLIVRDGSVFVHIACNVEEPPPFAPTGFLGIDLGVANLATTSDGQQFSGALVEAVRVRHAERRRRLNREATRQKRRGKRPKNVRRALNRLGRREMRFRRDVNHCITKQVVLLAQGTQRGIAVEDLNGIRARIRFAKSQRAKMGGWAFAQWQAFCAYKARRAGVPYVVVNPAYTSQTCFACGVVDKASRLDQASFVCTACGHTANADVNAAQNIGCRAQVGAPKLAKNARRVAA